MRRKKLETRLGTFVRQYARRGRTRSDPNDRRYDREVEAKLKRLPVEELDELLRGERDEFDVASAVAQFASGIDLHGYAVAHRHLPAGVCLAVAEALPSTPPARGGIRNLLDHDAVRELVVSGPVVALVRQIIDDFPVAVNATLFEKTGGSNWRVPLHQDTTVPVKSRIATSHFTRWRTSVGTARRRAN